MRVVEISLIENKNASGVTNPQNLNVTITALISGNLQKIARVDSGNFSQVSLKDTRGVATKKFQINSVELHIGELHMWNPVFRKIRETHRKLQG